MQFVKMRSNLLIDGLIQCKKQIIIPWRLDVARNESLKLVPDDCDVCVCTDLDEVLMPGWREVIEKNWTPQTKRGRYRYTWSFNEDGSEGCVFDYEKIHARHDYQWIYPVHEVLKYSGGGSRDCRLFKRSST